MQTTRRRLPKFITWRTWGALISVLVILMAGCHYDMYDQPVYRELDPSTFFDDGRASRPIVDGAISLGDVRTDAHFYTGIVDGVEVDTLPFPADEAVLLRGQEQYNIFCAPCHGTTGYGQSMVAQRGGIVPANLHQQRLRDVPIGHFYVVTTNGYRFMYSYASRIDVADRWAIAAYIRALQLSQNAAIDDVPAAERPNLESQP